MFALFVLSVAASYGSAALAKARLKSPYQKYGPSVASIRGTPLPYLLGRHRLGPIVGWVGNRSLTAGVYHESAWHQLCLGPAHQLRAIRQAGEVIWSGAIGIGGTASGTVITTSDGDQFEIYWGEETQPVSALLAAAIGIVSGWPFICYVYWRDKALGTSPTWPQLEYEIEVRSTQAELASAPVRIASDSELSGVIFAVDHFDTVGPPIEGNYNLWILGQHLVEFVGVETIRLRNNLSVPDQNVPVHSVTVVGADTKIFIQNMIPWPDVMSNTGEIELYYVLHEGENPAAVLSQTLMGRWPHGLELDRSSFDQGSLEELGQLMVTEGLPATFLLAGDDELSSGLAGLLQDAGTFLAWDPTIGRYRWMLLRDAAGIDVPAISDDVAAPAPPEIEVLHRDRDADRITFGFPDSARNWTKSTITIDDDGQAEYAGHQRGQEQEITIATDFLGASRIAERRAPELLARPSRYRIAATREARLLMPGQPLTMEGVPGTLRILEIEIDPLTGRVQIDAITDIYGSPVSAYETPEGG